jgi:division protein CdvB (Snf7/Vps24/ESCRT-III family)
MSSLTDWSKRWDKPPARETVGSKIKSLINPPPPVKHQLIQAIYKIGAQINKLDFSLNKLQHYDKQLFEKVVNSLMQGDKTKANMYANEVAEVRKMAKILMTIRYALERVKLRLETALIVGETQANLAPAIVALKQVTGYLKGMMPDVFTELIEVEENLNMAMMQMTTSVPIDLSSEFVTEEARKILHEASVVAEQRLKQQFPELPALQAPASLGEEKGEVATK